MIAAKDFEIRKVVRATERARNDMLHLQEKPRSISIPFVVEKLTAIIRAPQKRPFFAR